MPDSTKKPRKITRAWQVVSVILAVAIGALVIDAALNNGSLWTQQPPLVEISSITLDVHYLGNRSGYIGPMHQNECGQCPIGLEEGAQARFTILNLSFNSSGPSTVYLTWIVNSSYPFFEIGSLAATPPAVTSQSDYNISYLAGSAVSLFPTFEIPSPNAHPVSPGNITITAFASPFWLPES
jgi:hypothetical protein